MSATRFALMIGPRPDGYTGVHMTDFSLPDAVIALDHWFACCPVLVSTLTGGVFPLDYDANECIRLLTADGIQVRAIPGTRLLWIPAESVPAFATLMSRAHVWRLSCAPVRQALSTRDVATYNIVAGESLAASHLGLDVFCDIVGGSGVIAARDSAVAQHLFNFLVRRGLDATGVMDSEAPARAVDFAAKLGVAWDNHQAHYRIRRRAGALTIRREDRLLWGEETFHWTGTLWESTGARPVTRAVVLAHILQRAVIAVLSLPALVLVGGIALIGRGLHVLVRKLKPAPAEAPPPEVKG